MNYFKKGFTLLELIIVIAIIGILATLGMTSYTASLQKSSDSKRKSDLNQIQVALELYKQDFGSYPLTTNCSGSWANSSDTTHCGLDSFTWLPGLTSSYMKTVPNDPKNTGSATTFPPAQYSYSYFSAGGICPPSDKPGEFYILTTRLEYSKDPAAGISKQITALCSWGQSGLYTVGSP